MALLPEELLMFSLASPKPAKATSEGMPLALSSGKSLDFEMLLGLAYRNGVLPFLYKNLKSSYSLPQDISRRLKHAYLATAASNMVNAEETVRIIDSFHTAGVEAIPLKGSIASEIIFGDSGLYLATDIDILVKPSDLERAKELLVKENYGYNTADERDLLSSHYHLIFHRRGCYVELHWNLAKRYFDVPPEFWWEDIRIAEYNSGPLTTLSPERYLLYAIFRLFDHGFGPLKFFVLIAGLIERYREDIDWSVLLAHAGRFKMKRLVLFALRLTHDILETELPADILKQKILGYDLLRDEIVSGILNSSSWPHLKMLFYLLLLESPHEALKVLSGRLFPKLSEIRLRYGLPAKSKTVYLYYLLNPIFLATRKQQRQ